MKNVILPLALFFLITCQSLKAQDLPAYKIYTQEGKGVKFSKMMKQLEDADIVLFGENHNNPIVHWLELKVTEAMYEQSINLAKSLEMLEADDQLIVNE